MVTCPAGCDHTDNYSGHETFIEADGSVKLQHETKFGEHLYGTVIHDVATGTATEVSVTLIDVEGGQAPASSVGLRQLASDVLAAADWLDSTALQLIDS